MSLSMCLQDVKPIIAMCVYCCKLRPGVCSLGDNSASYARNKGHARIHRESDEICLEKQPLHRRSNPLRMSRAPGVRHHDAHAVQAIISIQITKNPNTRMIHLGDGGDAFCCAEPQHGDLGGKRQG